MPALIEGRNLLEDILDAEVCPVKVNDTLVSVVSLKGQNPVACSYGQLELN